MDDRSGLRDTLNIDMPPDRLPERSDDARNGCDA
jgi:hypothetical protein